MKKKLKTFQDFFEDFLKKSPFMHVGVAPIIPFAPNYICVCPLEHTYVLPIFHRLPTRNIFLWVVDFHASWSYTHILFITFLLG